MSKTPKIDKITEESKKYLENPVGITEVEPPTVGDKTIVRQNNVIILALEEILNKLENIEIPIKQTSKSVEALDLAKKPTKKKEVSPFQIVWDPYKYYKEEAEKRKKQQENLEKLKKTI